MIPAKKVPLGIGVNISPSFTIKILAVAVSATLPIISATSAFENPLSRASASILALLGYKHPAFALTTLSSNTGRLNLVVVRVAAKLESAIGISSKQIANPVSPFLGTIARSPPSIAQYIGLI